MKYQALNSLKYQALNILKIIFNYHSFLLFVVLVIKDKSEIRLPFAPLPVLA